MERSQTSQRLGVLAFAFDAPGRRLLDILAERPDLGQALLICHHAVAGDGDAETNASPVWFRCSPGTSWKTPPWSSGLTDLVVGYEAAVRDALDARRWRGTDQGVDLVELLLISPAAPSGLAGLPQGTLAALQRLRRRYRRLGRILLVTEGSFETVGESGVPGRLSALPFTGGGKEGHDGDLFNLILLLDRVNLEGMVLIDEDQASAHTAAAIVQLTVGELSTALWEYLQAEAARLQAGGRYISLGVAEWRLEPHRAMTATGELLFQRMAAVVASQAEATHHDPEPAGPEPQTRTGGTEGQNRAPGSAAAAKEAAGPETAAAGNPGSGSSSNEDAVLGNDGAPRQSADPWVDELPHIIEAITPEKQDRDLDVQEDRSLASLRESVSARGWSVAHLIPLLSHRVRSIQEIERRERRTFALFMQRFAPWYARKQAGLGSRQSAAGPILDPRKVLSHERVALFVAALMPALIAGVAAAVTQYRWELGSTAGIFAVAAAALAIRGFYVMEDSPPPPPSTPSPDLIRELRLRCARLAASAEIRRRSERAADRLGEALGVLKKTAVNIVPRKDSFPFSEQVCSALLSHRGLTASAYLARFWAEQGPQVLADLTRGGDGLPARLRSFADDCCRDLANIEWGDVLQALGDGDSLALPLWRQELEQARDAAAPRIPVDGKSSYAFLALPRRLPEAMKDALAERYPGQVTKIEIDGGAVLVVRITQGYEAASQ